VSSLPPETDVPQSGGRMLRTLIVGGLIALLATGAWELGWRQYGFTAGVNDDDNTWALERLRVPRNDPDAVVFAGTSRTRRALIPEAWAAATGMARPAQLSVAGSASQELLAHLANSEDFRGIVLLDLAPATFLGYPADSAFVQVVQTRLQAYTTLHTSPARRSEALLRQCAQRYLVSFSPKLGAPAFYRRWVQRDPRWFFLDRSQVPRFEETEDFAAFEYARALVTQQAQQALAAVQAIPEPERLARRAAMAEALTRHVTRIQARGGAVVFVQHPITGEAATVLEAAYPRAAYWDYFAAQVPGLWLHFADHAETRDLIAIDSSHLSQKTAEAYTPFIARTVLKALGREGHFHDGPP
jgi:hypothetical protein